MNHLDAPPQESLTPRQALALPHIACASSVMAGAKLAQIGRSTLQRWMHDPRFRSELDRMRTEAASLAQAKLQGLMLKSVLVLDDTLDAGDPVLRLRAARTTLDAAFRTEEARDLRRRLDLLDDALTLLKNQL